jgi:hypothetical protein
MVPSLEPIQSSHVIFGEEDGKKIQFFFLKKWEEKKENRNGC